MKPVQKHIQNLVKHPRLHRGFCTNSEQHLVFDHFAGSSILDVEFHLRWQDFEFAPKATEDFAKKAPSQMFDSALNLPLIISRILWPLVIFPKLLAIFLYTNFD